MKPLAASGDLLRRYGLAVVLGVAALALRAALPVPHGTSIYQLPLAAVLLSAWFGGRVPGLVALLICAAGTLYWFIPPVHSFSIEAEHVLGFGLFIAVGCVLSEFSSRQRRAEHALRASEERFRTLVQFSFDVYWESDAQHRFTRQEFTEQLADAPARGSEIGKTRWEVPYLEPDEEAWRRHRATMDAHLPFRDFELARPTPDGGKRYVSVSGMPVFDDRGRFTGYRGVGRHISERKRIEAELRARQDMLDLAQKAARAVAFDWYIGTRESENRWSPELEAMYGLEPDTFDRTFEGWKKLVHPDDWPAVKVAIQRANQSGDIAAEYRVVHKDSSVRWLRATGRMLFDAKGQPERMVGFMIDVTDWRQAEEEHKAYLRFLESMDRINRAIQATDELDTMMSAVLEAALDIFACDRAWLIYPCDPAASSWRPLMEITRPQFPGAFALQEELPMDTEVASVFEAAQTAPGPILFGPDYQLQIPASAAERFTIRSQIAMAIETKGDKRHLFGLHQCSRPRVWTAEEQRLFQEIGRRLGDAIAALSMLRNVRDNERRLDAAQRIAHVGWWERDFATMRVSLSEETQRIFGVRPVDLPKWQDRWVNLIHPEDRARAAEAAAAARHGGPRYDIEYRVIRPDGTVRVVRSQGDVIWDESGHAVRQFGVMQDITELRRAEDDLSEIRERFRVLAESSLTGIYLTENQRFSYVNPALAKMFGYTVEEIVGRLGSMDLTCSEDRHLVAENIRRRLEGETEEMRYEFRGLRKDGSVFPVEVHGRRIEHGGKIGVLGTLVDNTERKRAEDELRASEMYLEEAQRLSHTGSWALDVASDKYVYTSNESDRIYGFDPQQDPPSREEVFERIHPEDRARCKRNLQKSLREKVDTVDEYRIVLPDGTVRYVRAIRHPILNDVGEVVQLMGTSIDITERKRAEESLRQSEAYLTEAQRLSHTGSWALDVATNRYVYTSAEFDRLFGFDSQAEAPTREAVLERMHPEDRISWKRILEKSVGEKLDTTSEYRIVLPDGRVRHIHTIRHPVVDSTGKVVKLVGTSIDITERKRAEEELRESEARFRKLTDLSADWYWRQDENLRFMLSGEEKVGFTPVAVGKTRWELPATPLSASWDEHRAVLAARQPFRDFQYSRIGPEGDTRYVSVSGVPVFDERGAFKGYDGVASDITPRKRAEQALRESEARFRTFVDRATDAFFLMDEQVRVVDVNRQACESLGWSREELIGMHPREFDVALDEPSIQRLAQRSRAGEIITFETRHRRKDGTVFPVEVRSGTFEQGGKLFYLALARDISERKRAEESLRQSEAYLTEAQRLSHTGSWAFDVASNRYVYTSEESDRLFGVDPQGEKPTKEVIFERIHPEDRSSWKRNLEKSLREKVDTSDQYRVVLPDGTVRHIHTIRHPVVNSAGEVVKLVGTSIDITERKRAEEELRASEARFRTFVDRAADAFFLHDAQLRIVDVNRQACESLGRSREELFGTHPREFDVGLDEASMRRLAERLAAGEIITFETRHRRRDGTVFPVEIRTGTFKQGGELFYLALARDITERKLAEETLRGKDYALQIARTELAHVSRLTTLGELTTSIVHEVSQPLGAMINSAAAGARWLAAEPPSMSEARVALDNIAADGKRAREVIARIRALTKRQAPRMGLLDLNRKIVEVVSFAEHELRSHDIVLETKLDSKLPQVTGDRVQLQQVLLNLIINAIEAMSAVNNRPRELTIVSARGPDGVLVEVRDSGIGLDSQHAERVFKAFYTTKSEGIGIGLSISRSIVEAHGGQLSASANEPYGAVFRFSLPIAEEGQS